MDRQHLCELIDAHRLTSDDLELPELAPLAEQIETDASARAVFDRAQRLDGRISQAMHDVPVPAGMCERILARLDAVQSSAVQSTAMKPVMATVSAEVAASAPQIAAPQLVAQQCAAAARVEDTRSAVGNSSSQHSRRRWLVGVAAVAASLLATVGMWRFFSHPAPLSADALLADGSRWHARLVDAPDWHTLVRGQILPSFPLALAVRAMPGSWADISAWAGRPAVAYALHAEAGRHATLFVIQDAGSAVQTAPPRIPGSDTGGLAIGVWQADGLVYVLVVEGDQRRYDQLLDPAGQPLA